MRCLLISGSPDTDSGFIKTQYRPDDFVVCADKGYEFAVNAQIKPDLIIGDFDSCNIQLPQDTEIITLKPQKDDTDTLSALKEAIKSGCDDFLILGALGGRLDHTLANLSLLLFLEQNNYNAEIKSENETVRLISNSFCLFENVRGKTFSVFPFACESAVVSYDGEIAYPARDLLIKSDFPVGISNIFLEDKCKITVKDGSCIIIINNKI